MNHELDRGQEIYRTNGKGLDRGTRLAVVKRMDYLIRNHPELADRWASGESVPELARDYFVISNGKTECKCKGDSCRHATKSVGETAVLLALKRLIPDEERERIAKEHQCNGYQKKQGNNENGNGKLKNPKRVVGGRRAYESGLVNLSSYEHSDNCSFGNRNKGILPYEGEEREVVLGKGIILRTDEKGLILLLREQYDMTWQQVADRVNLEWEHEKSGTRPRKANSLRVAYQEWRK